VNASIDYLQHVGMVMINKIVNALKNNNVSHLKNGILKQGHANAWRELKLNVFTDTIKKNVNVLINLNASYLNNGTLKLILVNVLIDTT